MSQEVVVEFIERKGTSFNSRPFSDNPPWIADMFLSSFIGRVVYEEVDYIIWAVHTKDGIMIAEPGDKIALDPVFGLVVTKLRRNRLTWDVVKPFEHEEPNDDPPVESV